MNGEVAGRNPYPGPRPFESGERPLFFGRDAEVADLTSLVTAHRLFLIYAMSGAGKTSLLNAGLIPSLEDQGFMVLPPARVRGLVPQGLDTSQVANIYVLNTLMGLRQESADPRSLVAMSLGDFLAAREHPADDQGFVRPPVLVFDQFEELFSFYPERWTDREGFFRQLAAALGGDPLLRAVLVMREDYVASLDPFAHLLPGGFDARYRLERLRHAAACAAVEGPLKDTRRAFAPGVAASLVDQLLAIRVESADGRTVEVPGEFVEPVQLQIACQSLWSELPADVTTITSEHLRTFGDVGQALRDFYERTLTRTVRDAAVAEADLRGWFDRHLITPAGTRGTVFRGPMTTEGIPNRAVDLLENQHLIRAELRAGARWYELTHDRFIRPIQASNEAWRQRVKVSQLQGQMQSNLRRFRFALLILALAGLGIVAYSQWTARRQIESHELAARALLHLSIDPEESLCLAVRSGELDRSGSGDPEIEDALRQALREFRLRAVLTNEGQTWVTSAAFGPDGQRVVTAGVDVQSKDTLVRIWDVPSGDTSDRRSHGDDIVAATFSGATPVTISTDSGGTARVLDAATGKTLVELRGTQGLINRASFSSDGSLIVTAGADGTARVWDAATGALVAQLRADGASLNAVAFSPDATRVVAGRSDGRAVIWDVRTARIVANLVGHTDAILDAAFSADEKSVVTASRDATLRVWDANNGRALSELRGHTAAVTSASFTPDGRTILSGSEDSTARTWMARTGATLAILRGHQGPVTSVSFSGDGRRAVTASLDGSARVWDVSEGQTASFSGHTSPVNVLAFDRDGQRFVTASDDGTARVWETKTAKQLGEVGNHTDAMTSGAFSPDGSMIATGGVHQPIQIWDAHTYRPVAALAHPGPQGLLVGTPIFSPDGRWIVTVGVDTTAKLWEARSYRQAAELKAEPLLQERSNTVIGAAFSPDSSRLVTVSLDRKALVWDLDKPEMPLTLPRRDGEAGHDDYLTDAGFSPDGRLVVTASADKTARVWDARTGEIAMPPLSHLGYVTSAAFSRDGRRIVTASADQMVRVWALGKSDRPLELRGHSAVVSSVTFPSRAATAGADLSIANFLLTTSPDGSARVWDMSTGTSVMVLPGPPGPVTAAFSPDGRTVATARENGLIQMYACEGCQSRAGLQALARSRLMKPCPGQ